MAGLWWPRHDSGRVQGLHPFLARERNPYLRYWLVQAAHTLQRYQPDYHNAAGFVALCVLKNAIEKAGTLDKEKVRAEIAKTNLETIYGTVKFKKSGQIMGTSVVLQILDGKVYEVYPHMHKKPVYPMPNWKDR
jgi:branched-chain amino acid transport system substrate-binding protein